MSRTAFAIVFPEVEILLLKGIAPSGNQAGVIPATFVSVSISKEIMKTSALFPRQQKRAQFTLLTWHFLQELALGLPHHTAPTELVPLKYHIRQK